MFRRRNLRQRRWTTDFFLFCVHANVDFVHNFASISLCPSSLSSFFLPFLPSFDARFFFTPHHLPYPPHPPLPPSPPRNRVALSLPTHSLTSVFPHLYDPFRPLPAPSPLERTQHYTITANDKRKRKVMNHIIHSCTMERWEMGVCVCVCVSQIARHGCIPLFLMEHRMVGG